MNLAQLIDPERVQRGIKDDPLARKPAPLPPMVPLTRTADLVTTQSAAIARAAGDPAQARSLNALLREIVGEKLIPEGLTFQAIVAGVGDRHPANAVQCGLVALVQQGDLRRDGVPGQSRWRITSQGRLKLPKP